MNKHLEIDMALEVLNKLREIDLQALTMSTFEKEKSINNAIEIFKNDPKMQAEYKKKLKEFKKIQNTLYDIRAIMKID